MLHSASVLASQPQQAHLPSALKPPFPHQGAMAPSATESQPLLTSNGSLRRRNTKDPCCHPLDPHERAIQSAVHNSGRVAGLVPAVPRNSPVLVEFLKRKVSAADEDHLPDDTKPKQHEVSSLPPHVRRTVAVVYVLAFLTMAVMTSMAPTLLLYLKKIGFSSSKHDITFYVQLSVIQTAVPVVCHVALAQLADIIGASRALAAVCGLVFLGLAGLTLFTESRFLFAGAFILYSMAQSLRPVRTIVLSDVTEAYPHARTSVMSYHALMTPLGALVGPLLWLACEMYKGDWQLLGPLRVNAFTLDYFAAMLFVLVMINIAAFLLPVNTREDPASSGSSGGGSSARHASGAIPSEEVIQVHMSDGRDIEVHPARFQSAIFRYFCTIMFCCNMSMGLYMVSFQPIMLARGTTGQELGLIYEVISVTAIVPPLLVAYLSKRLMDRQILLIGLVVKILGITLFLPVFGDPVPRWSIVAGFVLLIKASVFFGTASMSLFTKLLSSGLSGGFHIGLLSSISALGPALAQLFFAEKMLSLFGGWSFGVFVLPVAFAFGLVLWPWYWKRLDSDFEFARRVREEYAASHSGDFKA